MPFQSDFAGAIVVEAARYGYPLHRRGNNNPKAIGLHTPEEPPDDEPSTPYYFHNLTDRDASTTYFVAWTGFVFQCVPEDAGAYGNALEGKAPPPWSDGSNLNLQTISIEIEGRARDIHLTMPRGSPQWVSLVRLLADICRRRPGVHIEWTFGHYVVSIYRSDPGQLDIGAVVADVETLLAPAPAKEWDEMATKEEIQQVVGEVLDSRLNPLNATTFTYIWWARNIAGVEWRFFAAPYHLDPTKGAVYAAAFERVVEDGRPKILGSYHHVPNVTTFHRLGGKPDWSNVVGITAAQLAKLPIGDGWPDMA